MMDQLYGQFHFECDACGETECLTGYEFNEAIQRIKELGWIIRKEDGDWCHYCGGCA